jgi:hypothetical protein
MRVPARGARALADPLNKTEHPRRRHHGNGRGVWLCADRVWNRRVIQPSISHGRRCLEADHRQADRFCCPLHIDHHFRDSRVAGVV